MSKNITIRPAVESTAKLYVCATPIGNLKDITLRVLETLKTVDIIAAEDTRTTLKLLNHYGIKKPVESYKGYAESHSAQIFISKLLQGKNIALLSEAGTPGISDPGYKLIVDCIKVGIDLEVLPGANGIITALVSSGLPTDRFSFEGFLPPKSSQRKERLKQISSNEETLIFYESPRRVIQTLKDINEVLGDRKAVLARELTKKFETILRDDISKLLLTLESVGEIKGEVILLIEGSKPIGISDAKIKDNLIKLQQIGISKKHSVKAISTLFAIKKQRVFDLAEKIV